MSLQRQILVLFLLLVGTTIGVTSYALLMAQERAIKAVVFKGMEGVAASAAHNVARFVGDSLREVSVVAGDLQGQPGRNQASVLAQAVRAHPRFINGCFVLDGSGRLLADYPPHPEVYGHSFAHRDYFTQMVSKPRLLVSQPYRSQRSGKPVLTFAAPLTGNDGQFAGLVGCSLDLLVPEVLDGLSRMRLGESGYLYMFDTRRMMIVHPDERRILQYDIPAGSNRLIDQAVDRGIEGADELRNSRGVPMLLALRRVPGQDWWVGAQLPQDEAYRDMEGARRQVLWIAGACLLLALLVGIGAVYRVVHPIEQLMGFARRLSSRLDGQAETMLDEEEALITRHRRDEIGGLARAFHELYHRLGESLGSLNQAVHEWERTFNSVHDGVLVLDPELRIERGNAVAAEIVGRPADACRGRTLAEVFPELTPPAEIDVLAALRRGEAVAWEVEARGSCYAVDIDPILQDGVWVGAVQLLRDITTIKEAEQHILEMAFYDSLTGLPNRSLLQDRLAQAQLRAQRSGKGTAVLFIDLDRFKPVNDSLGHAIGDKLLRDVSTRLKRAIRRNDTVARWGGDEFVIVMQEVDDLENGPALVAEKVLAALATPFPIEGHSLHIGCSIGIASAVGGATLAEALLVEADAAMYRAKSAGRGCYAFAEQQQVSGLLTAALQEAGQRPGSFPLG